MENLLKALRLTIPASFLTAACYSQHDLEIEAFLSFTGLLLVELALIVRKRNGGRVVPFYCLVVFLFVSFGGDVLGGGMGMETASGILMIPLAFALIASTIVYFCYAILDLSGHLSSEPGGAGQPDTHPEKT